MVSRGKIIALPTKTISAAYTPQKPKESTLAASPTWKYIGPADIIDFEWQIGKMGLTFDGITQVRTAQASQVASPTLAEFSGILPPISLEPLNPGYYDCEIWFRNKFDDLRVIVKNCVRIIETVQAFYLSTSVSPSGKGSVSRSPDQSSYAPGTLVTLTAVPKSGYYFDHWSGDASGSSTSVGVRMDGNRSVTAYFKEQEPEPGGLIVTFSNDPTSGGYITPEPWMVEYQKYDVVACTAVGNVGWTLDHWTVNGKTYTGWKIYITITEDTEVIAHWRLK